MNTKRILLIVDLLLPVCMQSSDNKISRLMSDAQVAEYTKDKTVVQQQAFNDVFNPWLYAGSQISLAVGSLSALVAGTTVACPRYHNDKASIGAGVIAATGIVTGIALRFAHSKNFIQAKKAADQAQ